MAEPMTDEEIAEMSRKTGSPIETVQKAACQWERIEQLLRKHPDATRDEAVYGIVLQDGCTYM